MGMTSAEWRKRIEALEASIRQARPAEITVIVEGSPEASRRSKAGEAISTELIGVELPSPEQYALYQEASRRRAAHSPIGRLVLRSTVPTAR
jgi:hypothetical protein